MYQGNMLDFIISRFCIWLNCSGSFNKPIKYKTLSNCDLISFGLGSKFLCATHIIPVKNEEGVVMMFILNFDYILEEGSTDSLERLNHTSPSKADQCE